MSTNSSLDKGSILIVGGYAGRGAGGSGRVFLEEVTHLRNKGFKVHVMSFHEMPAHENIFSGAYEIEVVAIPKRFRSQGFLAQNIDRILQLLVLRKKIKEIKPAVSIAYSAFSRFALYLATLFTSYPYVVHVFQTRFWPATEGKYLEPYALIHRKVFNEIRESVPERKEFLPPPPKLGLGLRVRTELRAIAMYLGIRKAKRVLVLSEQMRWEVRKLYGKDAFVSKGAFSSQMLNYKPRQDIKRKLGLTDRRIILNVNTLVPKKRVDLLIRAFERVLANLEDVVLIIGGVGPEEAKLKNLVEELNIGDKVRFMGLIPEQELWDYYAACDVCAHLDCCDFALSGYEPLALQKKVVWSSENEIDETLAQNKHIFITRPTIDDAARALGEALTREITEINDVSNYTWDVYFENLLREMLPIMAESRR